MAPTPEKDICNTVEAAEMIGIKPATLRMWRHEGRERQPPFTKVGRAVRYSRKKLAAWMKANEVVK